MSDRSRPPLIIHGAHMIDADGVVDDFWLAADGGIITATGTETAGSDWQTNGTLLIPRPPNQRR